MTGWPALVARIRRQDRQLRIARALCRLFRLDEVEPLRNGEYAVAAGYVTLWNDARPVVEAARHVALQRGRPRNGLVPTSEVAMRRLGDALESYYDLYPEHLR